MLKSFYKVSLFLLTLTFSCHSNIEPPNSLKANLLSSKEYLGAPYYNGLSRNNASLKLYLNKKNDGFIVWTNGIRRIKDSKPFGKELQYDNRIDKVGISLDDAGNGFLGFISPSGNYFENMGICFKGLLGVKIQNYDFKTSEIKSLKCFGSNSTSKFLEPIIKLDKKGNGYIIWMESFDLINSFMKTYVSKIENYQITNITYFYYLENNKYLYLYENEKTEIAIGMLDFPTEVKTVFLEKLGHKDLTDNNDFQSQKYKVLWTKQNNGFITWLDEKKNFFIQKIEQGIIIGEKIKLTENISDRFDIVLNEKGQGILIWTEKNILYTFEIANLAPKGKKLNFVEASKEALLKFPNIATKEQGYLIAFIETSNNNGGNVYLKEFNTK